MFNTVQKLSSQNSTIASMPPYNNCPSVFALDRDKFQTDCLAQFKRVDSSYSRTNASIIQTI